MARSPSHLTPNLRSKFAVNFRVPFASLLAALCVTATPPPVDMASSDETPTTYLKDYAPFPYDVEKVRAPVTRNAQISTARFDSASADPHPPSRI